MRFNASDEFKDMLFEQYKVANCGEITDVMMSELSKNYLPCLRFKYRG
jgi:hypothetical protein